MIGARWEDMDRRERKRLRLYQVGTRKRWAVESRLYVLMAGGKPLESREMTGERAKLANDHLRAEFLAGRDDHLQRWCVAK